LSLLFRTLGAVLVVAAVCRSALAQDSRSEAESRPASEPSSRAAESRPESRPGAESVPPACEVTTVCKGDPYPVHGFVNASYRGRTGGGSKDNDLYAYLVVDAGNPELDDAIFHLMGRITYDFEGSRQDDPFNSLNDIGGGNFDGHVYEAFVDLQKDYVPDGWGLERVRIGRQDLYAAFTYLVDGIRLDFKRQKSCANARVTVFGGVPEYLYEDDWGGNWIAGFDVGFEPWRDSRMHVRYAHIQDDTDWSGYQVDDYASVSIRQQLNESWAVWAEWNTVDGATRDISCRVDWMDLCHDFDVHARYRYQSTIITEYTTPYDPYVGVLGPSYAYHQIDVDGSKIFCGGKLGLDAGFSARILQDSSNETEFNHEFVRLFTTLSTYGWPSSDVDLSVTGELWKASGGEDTFSAGAEATWRANPKLRFTAGSYYSLYKSDLFIVDERQDATTIFLKAVWRPKDCLRVDGRLEYETSDEGDFLTAIAGVTWTF
jgi:hypothetical protein